MTPQEFNNIVSLSLTLFPSCDENPSYVIAEFGKDELGYDIGSIHFNTENTEKPWSFVRIVRTDVGRHNMVSEFLFLNDLLQMLLDVDYPKSLEGHINPFLTISFEKTKAFRSATITSSKLDPKTQKLVTDWRDLFYQESVEKFEKTEQQKTEETSA